MGFSLTPLDWVVCMGALVGSIVIGLWLSVRAQSSKSSAGFFLAGRSLTWPIIGASLFATNIGAEHLVGLSGDSYRYGICAGTVELTTAMCLGFAAAVLLPFYFKNKVYTIPEFLEMRYSARARSFFSGLMLVICIMTKTAFTMYAGSLVLTNLLGMDPHNLRDMMTVVVGLSAVVAVVTMIGGFTTVAYTDAIQTLIVLVGSGAMLFIGLDKIGGWDGLCNAVQQPALAAKVQNAMHMAKPYDHPQYPFWGVIMGAIYGGIFYWGMDQVNVQRLLGARDLRQARWGAMFAVLLKLTPVFIFALPGVIAFALSKGSLEGEQSKQTFVWLLNNLLPSGLRGLLLASLLAALISSLLAVMNSISTMVVRDFVLRANPNTTERKQVLIGRWAILVASILGTGSTILIWRSPDGIYMYLQAISIALVMPITPIIVFGIMSKRVTMKGAMIAVAVGSCLSLWFQIDQFMGAALGTKWFPVLHHKLTENYTYRGLWGTIIITAVLFIASAFTPKTKPDKLANTTINWSAKLEAFEGLKDWRLQLAVLSVITVLAYRLLW